MVKTARLMVTIHGPVPSPFRTSRTRLARPDG